MSSKKLIQNTEATEAVKSFVFPVKLRAAQQKKADDELLHARRKVQVHITDRERLIAGLLQLKFQLEDYINSDEYDPKKNFGSFLLSYLNVTNKRSSDLANDIKIHKTLMSQIINNKRPPNDSFIVRLELHSNNTIPADYWFKLIQKEQVHELQTNRIIRKRERKHVLNKLPVRL